MPRPKTIQTEKIVDVARKLFLEQGFGVSTALIAKAAGISEGSIFKRFPTKELLFREAMGIPSYKAERLEARMGAGDPKENLVELCHETIAFFRKLLPRVTMLLAHPSFNPADCIRENKHAQPLVVLRSVRDHFAAEMKLGRIRACDPEVVARMIIGSLHHLVFFEMLGVQEVMPMPTEHYVQGLVDVVWKGLEPETE